MQSSSFTILLNKNLSPEDKAKLSDDIATAFQESGRKADIVAFRDGKELAATGEKHVKAAKESGSVIIAAGGDGTINFVAGLCYKHQVTLGIIPLGTFNYFARELGIATDIKQAVTTIVTGVERKVSIGLAQDRVFLNNASFGLYSQLIRQREEASSRFGRVRIVAALAAIYSLFTKQRLFSVSITVDGHQQWHKTAMVFVGNNTLQLENLGMKGAECTAQDKLAVIILKGSTRFEIARFLLRGMARNLKDEDKIYEVCCDDFEMKTDRKHSDLVIDGEIIHSTSPMEFKIAKKALTVIAPVPEAAA